ncbi:MAG TPA: hypothetical protein VN669_10245 [Candidatus Acidoferrales bacterium]|jgi:hypothetical protein|nr:hypothetical protein [Candidatus Acidoferrales bacterium]
MAKKPLQELLAKAEKDSDLATKLIQNPSQFKEEYELTEEQMAAIAGAGQHAQQHRKNAKGDLSSPDSVYEIIL